MNTAFYSENLKGRYYLVDQDIDGRLILKKEIECMKIYGVNLVQEKVHGNEHSGSIKGGEFLY
jgi:hypothetical protein